MKERIIKESPKYFPLPFLEIQTKRLDLHLLQLVDAVALLSYRSLPEVYKYQQWAPRRLEETLDFIRKYSISGEVKPGNWKQLGIFLKENQQLIGDCGFCLKGEEVEIGYTISPEFQGQGYGKEAVKVLIDFLFQALPIERIVARTDPKNLVSIGLLKRLHFIQTGFFPRSIKIRSRWKDDVLFSLKKEVWVLNIQPNP
jgi:RimJ/RimL family protein N-acetyltransferase